MNQAEGIRREGIRRRRGRPIRGKRVGGIRGKRVGGIRGGGRSVGFSRKPLSKSLGKQPCARLHCPRFDDMGAAGCGLIAYRPDSTSGDGTHVHRAPLGRYDAGKGAHGAMFHCDVRSVTRCIDHVPKRGTRRHEVADTLGNEADEEGDRTQIVQHAGSAARVLAQLLHQRCGEGRKLDVRARLRRGERGVGTGAERMSAARLEGVG